MAAEGYATERKRGGKEGKGRGKSSNGKGPPRKNLTNAALVIELWFRVWVRIRDQYRNIKHI